MSSASSADRAIDVENVMAAALSQRYFIHAFNFDPDRLDARREMGGSETVFALILLPESNGKSLAQAKKATATKVRKKGNKAKAAAVGVRCNCAARRTWRWA